MAAMDAEDLVDLVEIYRAANYLEADRAVVEVLEPAGIPCARLDRQSHVLPAPDAQAGAHFIAVPADQAEKARALLKQALADQALDPQEGEILG